ncbi:unnamed protein product [Brachionus calyciflorus]|uniref:Uncharacterized protein n=1 Tax=Brachionus calyciflorus TaxID=104777 RepID=A0A814NXP2_9BILA|nr:unnamed protein product [Brachionus calyciflorus]
MIENDVGALHYTVFLENFNSSKQEILSRWSQFNELSDFKLYFESKWLEGQWLNWPLFTFPAGFSTTNNNTEGFSKTIKNIYTSYERSTILEGCNVFKRMVIDLSLSQVKFDLAIQRKKSIVKEAEVLNLSDFLIIDRISAYRVANGQNK